MLWLSSGSRIAEDAINSMRRSKKQANLHMRLVVVSGASELALLADCLAEDEALFEEEHVQLLALVIAA